MGIKFITNQPAAFIQEEKALVIAELHLGLEHELFKKGITILPQRGKFQQDLERLSKITKAKTLIIIGDIKHKVPGMSIREERELPKFLDWLKEKFKVILVKGNHDAEIEQIVPKGIEVYGSRGLKLGKYGFFHGHAWPSKRLLECDYIFLAHLHPAIEFKDKFGFRNIEQVWVKGKIDAKKVRKKYKLKKTGKLNVIIMPTFNQMLGSMNISKLVESEESGIISKLMNLENSKIYLLDGTFLGHLKNLKS
ncbi:MAG: metallophosphoesterase [Candidatus Aenigmatarchaeota archaeon]